MGLALVENTKVCQECGETKPDSREHFPGHRWGTLNTCRACYKVRKARKDKEWHEANPMMQYVYGARHRAKQRGTPCTITLDDLAMPTHCPVFGIPLKPSKGTISENSPVLDCVIPELGYVPGNVQFISNKANLLKGNMTLADLRAIAKYIKTYGTVI